MNDFIGALGENYTIDYINNISYNSSNYTDINELYTSNYILNSSNNLARNILNTSNYVYNINNTLTNSINTINADISGINSSITTIEGEITTLQGEVATNTADIITANGLIGTNTAAIAANGIITTANTAAIATCLKKSQLGSGNVGLVDELIAGGYVNVIYNNTEFEDRAVIGVANRVFNLTPLYENLPTTKQNVITWNSPLSYNSGTNTASIDLSSYPNYTYLNGYSSNYISSNVIANVLTPYDTIALRNTALTSYPTYTYQNAYSSNYISSNIITNVLKFYSSISYSSNYISSNVLTNVLSFYPSYTYQNAYSSNYISSNIITNLLGFYPSSNVLTNVLSFYPSYTYQNAYSSNYISSNIIANVLSPYDTIALRNTALTSYPTYTYLNAYSSNYISSNIIANVLTPYDTIALRNTALTSYPTYTYQNAYSSNYISSNVIANVLTPYDTIALRNTALTSYPTYTYLNAYSSNYISSNVIANVLTPYDTIALRNTALTSYPTYTYLNAYSSNYISSNALASQQFINSNSVAINYLSSNVFTSNIYFTSPIQILPNESYPAYPVPNSSLIVGDGGRLTINGKYGTQPLLLAYSCIGVGDNLATGGGTTNTSITLWEHGMIKYNGFAPDMFSHFFNGAVYMPSLNIANLNYPLPTNALFIVGAGTNTTTIDNTGKLSANTLALNNGSFSVDSSGNITIASIKQANNLILRAPFTINANQTATINGQSVNKYDLDLRLYTNTYTTSEGYKMRYFEIHSIYSDASYTDGGNLTSYLYNFRNRIYMTDNGGTGLTIFNNDGATDTSMNFIGNNYNYWMRNSFNYLTFINGQKNGTNYKWYIIINDILS